MRTLFLRIFLSFWGAMVLVVLATAGLAWFRFSQIQVDGNALAGQAQDRVLKGGEASLRTWLREAKEKYPRFNVYILDPSGVDLLKRELTQPLASYAERMERAGYFGKGQRRDAEPDPLLLAPQFADSQGAVYTFMMSPVRNSPLGLLSAPYVIRLVVVVVAFALVISGLVCWWLARYLSKPIERLRTSARSLAAGNLEARVGEDFSRRRDELGVLARDFDTMADHVRNILASKESLLRGMSHELRSPLARLRVALSLARRDGEDLGRQLDRIELEAERLDTLIGQMLQLSQLRAVEPMLPRSPVDLTSLLSEVVEDARLEASAVDKHVEWAPSGVMCIEGDHDLMRSAIENVLRNAVRFTERGTAVTVTSVQESDQVHIVIDDHGPGVPVGEAERIFEPFYRVAEARDRDSGGTGLGLAITARVVKLYNGAVLARNRQEGGLSVRITLPAMTDIS
jgi:two-component system sensor histidine kinase CpxA